MISFFDEFHSELYTEDQLGEEVQGPHNSDTRINFEREDCNDDVKNEISEFAQDEVLTVIDCLIWDNASENNGIRTEDIKTSDETTKDMIRQIFNEVMK